MKEQMSSPVAAPTDRKNKQVSLTLTPTLTPNNLCTKSVKSTKLFDSSKSTVAKVTVCTSKRKITCLEIH